MGGGSLYFVTEAEFLCLIATISHFHKAASALPDQLSSLEVLECVGNCPSELCRQPEDLEGVEGGGEGHLLRGLVQVGGDHLDGDRQGARLVSLQDERLR